MTDEAVPILPVSLAHADSRRRAMAEHRAADWAFRWLTWAQAVLVLLMLAGIMIALVAGAVPAFDRFGWSFLTSTQWNPVTDQFGALVAIYGTIVSALIAMAVAIPLSFGVAYFLTELCPGGLRRPIGTAVELLAAVPSIIYGIWGLFVFVPFMQTHVQPILIETLGEIPIVGALFAGPPYGIGMLTAGIILGLMVLPYVASIMRDSFAAVPSELRESAYALGCTSSEVMWSVVAPYARRGVIGGVLLGFGRALGETMAVTFVVGNAHSIQKSLLAPGTTIAATLANEFTEAVGSIYTASLIGLGLVLFAVSFSILGLAKIVLLRDQTASESR